MSETPSNSEAPTNPSAIAEIREFQAEKSRLAQLESLVGDGTDENRNVEAAEYYAHLEGMSKRNDDFEYGPSLEGSETDDLDLSNYDPQLRRLDMMANNIADLQLKIDTGSDKEKAAQILADKEAKFQEVFDKYENTGQMTDHEYRLLENILHKAYPEKSEAEAQDAKESDNSSEVEESVEADQEAEDDDIEQDDEPESEKIDEKGAESLPEQEKTIVKAAIDRARDLYYKAGSLYGSAINKTSEFFMPKQGELESPWEYEDRLKRETFFKAIGLTALAAISLFAGSEIIQNVSASHSVDINSGNNPSPEAPGFNGETLNIESGDGWFDAMKKMGIPKSEWGDLLQKVGPQLESSGYAYQMGDSYGISSPGELPKKVLELIQNSR